MLSVHQDKNCNVKANVILSIVVLHYTAHKLLFIFFLSQYSVSNVNTFKSINCKHWFEYHIRLRPMQHHDKFIEIGLKRLLKTKTELNEY